MQVEESAYAAFFENRQSRIYVEPAGLEVTKAPPNQGVDLFGAGVGNQQLDRRDATRATPPVPSVTGPPRITNWCVMRVAPLIICHLTGT